MGAGLFTHRFALPADAVQYVFGNRNLLEDEGCVRWNGMPSDRFGGQAGQAFRCRLRWPTCLCASVTVAGPLNAVVRGVTVCAAGP